MNFVTQTKKRNIVCQGCEMIAWYVSDVSIYIEEEKKEILFVKVV